MRVGPLVLVVAVVAACAGGPAPTSPGPSPAPVGTTAFESFSPAVDAARSAVATRLAQAGFGLQPPIQRYEPGQPPSLQTMPRAVYRIDLIDPDQGYVVIYDVGAPDAAVTTANDFAQYLGSFGHSNYPADAEFTLNVVGNALVFNWWAASRSSDPDRARAAFEVISGIGQRVDVID